MKIRCASDALYVFRGAKFFEIVAFVRMVRGVPLSEQKFVKNFITVRVSVFLQICAVGHLLKRSTATQI